MRKDRAAYNEYMRIYHLKRYHKKRSEIIQKLGGACKKCGSTVDLEIDHIKRESKEYDVGKAILSVSKELLDKEIEKCQILCSECHKHKTTIELGKKILKGTHGTVSSYTHTKCRCDSCKKAHSEYMKQYKNNRIGKKIAPVAQSTEPLACTQQIKV